MRGRFGRCLDREPSTQIRPPFAVRMRRRVFRAHGAQHRIGARCADQLHADRQTIRRRRAGQGETRQITRIGEGGEHGMAAGADILARDARRMAFGRRPGQRGGGGGQQGIPAREYLCREVAAERTRAWMLLLEEPVFWCVKTKTATPFSS